MKASKYTFLVSDPQEINHRRIINENPLDDAVIVITKNWAGVFIKEWLYDAWRNDFIDTNDFHEAMGHKWNDSFYYCKDLERKDIQYYVKEISESLKSMKKKPVRVSEPWKKERVNVLSFNAER